MSSPLTFSESTNKTGIYELFQDLTGTNTTSYPIAKFTRDANNAMAYFKMLADRASGRFQNDDFNQPDYPIVKFNLVSGQYDYTFNLDGTTSQPSGFVQTGNQIWDIYRIECATDATTGKLRELIPIDQSDTDQALGFLQTQQGPPYYYDKTANSLFLYPTPSFSSTASTNSGGLWVYVNRAPAYFTTAATTQRPGIPEMFYEYIAYRPAYLYMMAKGLPQKNDYFAVCQKIEADIQIYFAQRNKDERTNITSEFISFR